MRDNASRRGAADLGMPLMILAFVVIGGFLFWLNGQAAEERALRVVEEEVPVEEDPTAQVVTPGDIQIDASPFEDQEVRIGPIAVASLLGSQGFWLEMETGSPFLVSMSTEVMAAGIEVAPGSAVTVTGVMTAMVPETLDAWTEAGTITDNDRIIAEFATHFIDATDVDVAEGAGGGSEGGS